MHSLKLRQQFLFTVARETDRCQAIHDFQTEAMLSGVVLLPFFGCLVRFNFARNSPNTSTGSRLDDRGPLSLITAYARLSGCIQLGFNC